MTENNGGDPALWTDAQRAVFAQHDQMMADKLTEQGYGAEKPFLVTPTRLVWEGLSLELLPNRKHQIEYGFTGEGPYLRVQPARRAGIQPGRRRARRRWRGPSGPA